MVYIRWLNQKLNKFLWFKINFDELLNDFCLIITKAVVQQNAVFFLYRISGSFFQNSLYFMIKSLVVGEK